MGEGCNEMIRWKPLEVDEELADMAIVYSKTRGVTIGLPGWKYSNNAITHYMPLPEHVVTDKTGWFSEYWGDNPPKKSGWYIVSLDRDYGIPEVPSNRKAILVKELFYDAAKIKWFGVPDGETVIAYRPFPEPLREKEASE
jgi:hypothetical protein